MGRKAKPKEREDRRRCSHRASSSSSSQGFCLADLQLPLEFRSMIATLKLVFGAVMMPKQ
jgi:hypothetical protein